MKFPRATYLKVFCRDWRSAQKWYFAVRLYLKDRLKLELSPEKSQIVNLRKRPSEFLGFTIRAVKKGNKRVAHTGINAKKKAQIKQMAKRHIQSMREQPTTRNANLYNSFVLGIHNYFKRATLVSLEFSRLAYDLRTFTYNRLKQVGKYEHPSNPPPTYTKWYSVNYRTFKVGGVYLFPIKDVRMVINSYLFQQELTPFTPEGRKDIHQKLKPDIQVEIVRLMTSHIPNRTVEYLDNRISRYSMKLGRCEITGQFLYAEDVHCHHYLPASLGGTDRFSNLRILHKDVHTLIHAKKQETIIALMIKFEWTEQMIILVNQYRKMSNLELINTVV